MAASKAISDHIDMLEPISPVAHQVLDLAADPRAGAVDLAEAIVFDPAITANVLRVCNSAYFGLAVQVDSIQHAVSLLGMDRMVEIITVHLVADCLRKKSSGNGRETESDWIRAVACAFLAKSIGIEKGLAEIPLLFTAALLKDIGLTIMDGFDANGRNRVKKHVIEEGFETLEAERAVYSIDHAVLGAIVADKWNFSGKLSHIIRFHHDPLQGIHADRDTAVVYLADMLCSMTDSRRKWDAVCDRSYDRALKGLGYCGFDVYRLISECASCIQAARVMFDGLRYH